jgi:flagellar basal-body rod modification protein FlgD
MITETTSATATTSSPSAAASAQTKLSSDFDDFLTMLVTQLQNQDPLDPLDTNEFTSQLVEFASVEQQIQQNANLESLIKVEQQAQATSMVGYLGHSVEIAGNQMPLQDGSAAGTYVLGGEAKEVTVTIKNSSGTAVASFPGETATGRHDVSWNGEDLNGNPLPDGIYKLEVKAIDKDGKSVPVTWPSTEAPPSRTAAPCC